MTMAGDGTCALLVLGFESADHPVDGPMERALEICREHGGEVGEGASAGREARAGRAARVQAPGAPGVTGVPGAPGATGVPGGRRRATRSARGGRRSCGRPICATCSWRWA